MTTPSLTPPTFSPPLQLNIHFSLQKTKRQIIIQNKTELKPKTKKRNSTRNIQRDRYTHKHIHNLYKHKTCNMQVPVRQKNAHFLHGTPSATLDLIYLTQVSHFQSLSSPPLQSLQSHSIHIAVCLQVQVPLLRDYFYTNSPTQSLSADSADFGLDPASIPPMDRLSLPTSPSHFLCHLPSVSLTSPLPNSALPSLPLFLPPLPLPSQQMSFPFILCLLFLCDAVEQQGPQLVNSRQYSITELHNIKRKMFIFH